MHFISSANAQQLTAILCVGYYMRCSVLCCRLRFSRGRVLDLCNVREHRHLERVGNCLRREYCGESSEREMTASNVVQHFLTFYLSQLYERQH